ncbi:MAG: helix-turn-helix domain-containing protein [bacterium]|nr:helix-turn-helix domain-containing protein [bacterium]
MTAHDLPYFKFVSLLIDSGVWARMTSAARTLYPVLLRFSDGSFKPVYPGTRLLLKLTGFKQKSSLRKARRELAELGLISMTAGSGRKNTCYHFRFDFQGDPEVPPWGSARAAPGGARATLRGAEGESSEGQQDASQYNKIHISINNNVQEQAEGGARIETPVERPTEAKTDGDRLAFFERRFGREMVDLAISECDLAGMPATAENIARILYRDAPKAGVSFRELARALQARISPGSFEMIESAFREEREGLLVFADSLPGHLRVLLQRMCDQVFFEPEREPAGSRRDFWAGAGGNE